MAIVLCWSCSWRQLTVRNTMWEISITEKGRVGPKEVKC